MLQNSTCIFFIVKGLVYSIQLKSKVNIIDSMSQVMRKLMSEVEVALIYVCKAFWREINTPAHLQHCRDSLEVKSQHLSPDIITKTCLFNYTENLPSKNENFQIKNSDIFHISAQNIDCGYSLEPPRLCRFQITGALLTAMASKSARPLITRKVKVEIDLGH